MQGGHDAALADHVRRACNARAGRWQSQHVACWPVVVPDVDEVGEPRVSLGYRLDGHQAEFGALREHLLDHRLEVFADLFCHSRWPMSPKVPTMRRSPNALIVLMLV